MLRFLFNWTVLLVCTTPTLAFATSYTITDLGTLGGNNSYGSGINNRGEVVGASYLLGDLDVHAFVYRDGAMIDLGTLGGTDSQAAAINDFGQVVGTADRPTGLSHAFMSNGNSMLGLGTLGGYGIQARGINSSGQIVGGGYRDAFLYSNGLVTSLGTFGGSSSTALGINDAGQIVGWYSTVGTLQQFSQQHAILYDNGVMTDLNPLLGDSSFSIAYDINASGQVVGEGYRNNGSHAFLYTDGTAIDLGTLGERLSAAVAINSTGQIVGYCMEPNDPEHKRPFVYRDGAMHDLNSLIDPASGWKLEFASDINDLGQIVATGTFGGYDRALLLTPVPEPSSFALAVLGLAGIAIWMCGVNLGRKVVGN